MLRSVGRVAGFAWRFLVGVVSLPSRVIGIVAVVTLVSGGWTWFNYFSTTKPAAFPTSLTRATQTVCDQVPPCLPRPQRALCPLLVLPLADDRELMVTQTLRDCLAKQSWYRPCEKGPSDRFLEGLFNNIGMPKEPVADPATAVKLAKAAEAEVVVFGRVDRFEVLDDGVAVAVHVQALGVDGKPLFDKTFTNQEPPATALHISFHISGPRLAIFAGLAAFTLLWPLVLVPLMRRVLGAESNVANLLAIVLISAVPPAVGWPVVFTDGSGALWVAVFGLWTVLSVLWCIMVMSRVAAAE